MSSVALARYILGHHNNFFSPKNENVRQVMGLRHSSKTTSGSNISTQNDYDGISYKLSYRQQNKVQILTIKSSKYLGLIYFKNLPKNEKVRKMSQQQQL